MSELGIDKKVSIYISNEFNHINAFIKIAKDTLMKLMEMLDTATCQILEKIGNGD